MKQAKQNAARKARRTARVRTKIKGGVRRHRLAVYRSLNHIYAQIIDDESGKTLAAAADSDLKKTKGKMTKTEEAGKVGELIAERAKAKKVNQVVFDRRDKKYHGRIKALAEGARAGGLSF